MSVAGLRQISDSDVNLRHNFRISCLWEFAPVLLGSFANIPKGNMLDLC